MLGVDGGLVGVREGGRLAVAAIFLFDFCLVGRCISSIVWDVLSGYLVGHCCCEVVLVEGVLFWSVDHKGNIIRWT